MKFLDKLRSLRKGKTQKKPEQGSSEFRPEVSEGCISFRVCEGGTEDIRGTALDGIYKVRLPELGREGYAPLTGRVVGELQPMETLRLDFDCPVTAAVLLKEPKKKHRIEVCAAAELWNAENASFDIHAYRYIMDAELVSVQQNELEHVKPMTTSLYFHVSRCKLIVGNEVLWDLGGKVSDGE